MVWLTFFIFKEHAYVANWFSYERCSRPLNETFIWYSWVIINYIHLCGLTISIKASRRYHGNHQVKSMSIDEAPCEAFNLMHILELPIDGHIELSKEFFVRYIDKIYKTNIVWVNNGEACDLIRHRANYDVTVLMSALPEFVSWLTHKAHVSSGITLGWIVTSPGPGYYLTQYWHIAIWILGYQYFRWPNLFTLKRSSATWGFVNNPKSGTRALC